MWIVCKGSVGKGRAGKGRIGKGRDGMGWNVCVCVAVKECGYELSLDVHSATCYLILKQYMFMCVHPVMILHSFHNIFLHWHSYIGIFVLGKCIRLNL